MNNSSTKNRDKANVLLVDDDEEVLQMLKLLLGYLHVDVTPFANPELALEYVKEGHPEIKCILCDLVMKPFNGLHVLSEIRTLDKKIPFYLMSANASQDDIQKANELLATGFIEKPMVHLKLEEIVASL